MSEGDLADAWAAEEAHLMAPPPAWDGDSCGLRGVVVSEEYAGVPGAAIDLLGARLQAVTEIDGSFSLSYVPPGSHEVRVRASGYEVGQERTDCAPGSGETKLLVVLRSVPPDWQGFRQTLTLAGRIGCAVGFGVSTPDYCAPSQSGLNPQANGTLYVRPVVGADVTAAVLEVRWQRAAVLGAEFLRLSFEKPDDSAQRTYCPGTEPVPMTPRIVRGTSVLCVRLEATDPDVPVYEVSSPVTFQFEVRPDQNTQEVLSDPAHWQDKSSKVVVDQAFDVAVTLFYNGEPVPPGFSAFAE